jgi:hypothetical protein
VGECSGTDVQQDGQQARVVCSEELGAKGVSTCEAAAPGGGGAVQGGGTILLQSWALLLLQFDALDKLCRWQQRRQLTLKVRHVDRSADVSQRPPAIPSTVHLSPKMIQLDL